MIIGSDATLSNYNSDRYYKNLTMMGTVDAINSIFSFDGNGINYFRSLGMLSINNLGSVKNMISKFAMGKK